MKHVLILRHGKSAWDTDAANDHDRPLAGRGRKAARLMGGFLTRLNQQPEHLVTSTAVRALHTAELARKAGRWACGVESRRELYGASPPSVLRLVQNQDDTITSLLLVGHEPTWSQLIGTLTGGGAPRFPTAAMARIDFAIDRWQEIQAGRGTLIWLVTPKLLQRIGFSA